MFLGSLPDSAKIYPAAVIGKFDNYLIFPVPDRKPNLAFSLFAKRSSFLGAFNAMVNRVSNQLCKDFLNVSPGTVIQNYVIYSFHHKTHLFIQRRLGFIAHTG